jgi:hypothetical protein
MLEKAKNPIAPQGSQSLTPSSTQPSAEKFRQAKAATARLLANWPESHREGPEYLAALTACLAHLDAEEIEALIHPATGLATRLKYLPTPADVAGFLAPMRAHKARMAERARRDREIEAFMQKETGPEIPPERRKEIVRNALGYDPEGKGRPGANGPVVDLPEGYSGSSIPDAPPSRELLALLEAEAKERATQRKRPVGES